MQAYYTPSPAILHRSSTYIGVINKVCSTSSNIIYKKSPGLRLLGRCSLALTGLLAAAAVITSAGAGAVEAPPEAETLENIPQTLSGECASPKDCKRARIQRPKSRKAESCTIKCVTTCIRGGDGSPGEGPLNVRRPLVVFKQGFRSRQYW
ncbi:uncharacterized protein LOC132186167 isoform X2 [Corylus avellana]|uniref:uncharacterized protein LOC132186167 isoform X2 n=1 Tax=Corylus avellana TaxID=13451 RepID=UPI00286CAFEF|nr:uncharacterized protein LOC132186167 isoform X2 [Corylus avellana]